MRYRVLDLPPRGAGAFMPTPSTNATASSWGLVHVEGSPGTDPVPAPKPQRDYLPSQTRCGAPDTAQGSDVAPDVILPAIYVAGAQNMGPAADGFGMAIRRRTPLPMPALDATRVPQIAQRTPRIGSRSSMVWPRAFQRFPSTSVSA